MQNLVMHVGLRSGYRGIKLQWSERTAAPLTNFFLIGFHHYPLATAILHAVAADDSISSRIEAMGVLSNNAQEEYAQAGRTAPGELQQLLATRVIVDIEPKGSSMIGGRIRFRYARTGDVIYIDHIESVANHVYTIR